MNTNINKLVDKIYVLTIERNSDRHPNIRSILESMDFEFWYGLDAPRNFAGKKYVSDIEDQFFINNDIDKGHVSRLTVGQFGAYFSIKKMINHVAKCEYDKVLIFEDDILPLKTNWKNILSKSLEELPEDWDILLVGYVYDGRLYKHCYNRNMRFVVKTYNALRSLLKKKNVIGRFPAKFSKHLDASGYCMGGHAYCLSKNGAKLLSSYLSPMQDSGDVLISHLIVEKKIKAYSVYPCLFFQDRRKFGSKTRNE